MARIDKREEINEELEDEDVLEGITITSRNDNAIKKTIGKIVVFVVLIGIVIGTYLYANSSIPEKGETVEEAVVAVAPYSGIDEALASYESRTGVNLVNRVDFYENLVNISETLHGYDLASITQNLEHLDMPEVLDMEKLEANMNRFEELMNNGVSERVLSKDSEEFVSLALELEAQERLVNYNIQGNAFNDLANLKLVALKTKVADCCEFDPSEIDSMQLLEVNGERQLYYTGHTGMTYRVHFDYGSLDIITSSNLVPSTMDSIFADQTYSGEATTDYNHEINERLLSEINTTRTFIKMDCSINRDGELVLDAPVAIQRLTHAFRSPEKNNEN